MFLLVGKGLFLKDALFTKLTEWGVTDPAPVIREAERKGRVEFESHRILLVR